jgi:membrane-associated protein
MSENIIRLLTDITPIFFYAVIFLLVYVETAFIFAFFIPGDTLLFSAGLVVAVATDLNIVITCFLISVAAFLGDQTSYAIGRKYGISYITSRNKPQLDSLLTRAEDFYRRHGGATIFLSRFYPWFRTLAPFLAGVGGMRRREFMAVNLISAFSWGTGITLLGYLANSIDALKSSSRYIAAFFICTTILLASKNYFEQRQIKETRSNV